MQNFDFRKMLNLGTTPEDNELNDLAKFMAKPNPPSSKIPAGYTYLAQFVDHDISLDSLARVNPWENIDVSTVVNLRNPVFDLETLYGTNAENTSEIRDGNTPFLKLGKTSTDPSSVIITTPIEQDLPRDSEGLATIFEARNDENLLVAQTHVAFIKFHNEIAKLTAGTDFNEIYKTAQRLTIRHYQYIILKDLLPEIVKESVLNDVCQNGNGFYQPDADNSFIPLEFSVAVFRMGHSMVRNTYNLNVKQTPNLFDLQSFTGKGREIKKTKALLGDWLINWNLFFNLTDWIDSPENFNFALKINTEIASGLGKFRPVTSFLREGSIPALDLYRGRLFNLPSGQTVAKAMGARRLPSSDIAKLLPDNLKNVFSVNTPLWFYILAEAQENEEGENLGEVGSRIVAEVFLELLKRSPHSIINDGLPTTLNFPSEDEQFFGMANGKFGMTEMLNFIELKHLESNPNGRSFLNPLGI